MDTMELLVRIANMLSTNTALSEWCNVNFGSDPMIYIGIDEANPPEATKYPAVIITQVRDVRVPGRVERNWLVGLSVFVENREVETSGNIVTYTGFLQAERMRELVENALVLYPGPVSFKRQGESVAVVAYPEFQSQTVVAVKMLGREHV